MRLSIFAIDFLALNLGLDSHQKRMIEVVVMVMMMMRMTMKSKIVFKKLHHFVLVSGCI